MHPGFGAHGPVTSAADCCLAAKAPAEPAVLAPAAAVGLGAADQPAAPAVAIAVASAAVLAAAVPAAVAEPAPSHLQQVPAQSPKPRETPLRLSSKPLGGNSF